MKRNCDLREAGIKNTNALLIGSFCLLILIKALLSLRFQSPWIMPDEVTYAKMAADVFGSMHLALSPGYPLFLSIAYLFSGDMNVIYHSMLLINCFVSSLTLFPSFFILNKYCPKEFAFMGAVLVAALPSPMLYTFVIMTENLFIPIFIFSIWFMLQAFETERPIWIFMAISSASLLFFTRHNGIFMVVSMVVSLAYYLLISGKLSDYRRSISYRSVPAVFTAFMLLFLTASAIILSRTNRYYYLMWIYNRVIVDTQKFLTLFADANNLKTFLALLQNEIGYMIIATYFIFMVLSLIFFWHLFLPTNKMCISRSLSEWCRTLGAEKRRSLQSTSVYFLLIPIVLLPSTTMYVYQLSQVFAYQQNWVIISRYIDPVIPGFFLFGMIALNRIHENLDRKALSLILASAVIFSAIFFIRFPTVLNADVIAIFFIKFFINRLPNYIAFPALAAGFFLLLIMYLNLKERRMFFLIALIIFSFCASAYTYHQTFIFHSDKNHAENQIGEFLNMHASRDSFPIFMDAEDTQRDWYFSILTRFWTKKAITDCSINQTLSDLKHNGKKAYLITSKTLPLEPLAISSRGYYLYSA